MEIARNLPGAAKLDLDARSLAFVKASLGIMEVSAPAGLVLAAATSTLCRSGADVGPVKLHRPDAAECARLMTKGRLLFEHCLERRSDVCIVGFLEHRLSVRVPETGIVADMIGWMTEEACHSLDGEAHALARRMIDVGIALLHGEGEAEIR